MISNEAGAIRDYAIARKAELENIDAAKSRLSGIDAGIAEIVQPEEQLKSAGKESGQVSFDLHGVKVTVKSDKKVEWDSNILMEAAAKLDWSQVTALFDIKFSMKETKYTALADNVNSGLAPQLKELLDAVNKARTVKITAAKVQSAEILD